MSIIPISHHSICAQMFKCSGSVASVFCSNELVAGVRIELAVWGS